MHAGPPRTLSLLSPDLLRSQVDLATGKGLHDCFSSHGPFDAVVNPAAISTPGTCEKDPKAARWPNLPASRHTVNRASSMRLQCGVSARSHVRSHVQGCECAEQAAR